MEKLAESSVALLRESDRVVARRRLAIMVAVCEEEFVDGGCCVEVEKTRDFSRCLPNRDLSCPTFLEIVGWPSSAMHWLSS